MKNLIPFLVVLVGCSGADESEPCDVAHRKGTFVFHAEERPTGDCGSVPDEVARIEDHTALPVGCASDLPDETSSDACTYTRSYTCVADDGSRASFDAVTHEHDGGKTFTGVLSVKLLDPNGGYVCSSAYDVTYTRQ